MEKYDAVVTNLAIQFDQKIVLKTTIHATETMKQQWLVLSVPECDGENITGYRNITDINLILYGDFSPFVKDNSTFNVLIEPIPKGTTRTFVFEFDISEHVPIFQICSAVVYIDTSKQIQKGNLTEAIKITATNHEKRSVMSSYAEVRVRRYLEMTKQGMPLHKKHLKAARVLLEQLNSVIHAYTYNELSVEIRKLEEYNLVRTEDHPPPEKGKRICSVSKANAPKKNKKT